MKLSPKSLVNGLFLAVAAGFLTLSVAAVLGMVRLGFDASVANLGLIHKVGIIVVALVMGLAMLHWLFERLQAHFFPHLVGGGRSSMQNPMISAPLTTLPAHLRFALEGRLPSLEHLERSLASTPAHRAKALLVLQNVGFGPVSFH